MNKKNSKKIWFAMLIIIICLVITFIIINFKKSKSLSNKNSKVQIENNVDIQTEKSNDKIFNEEEIKQQANDIEKLREVSMQLEMINDRLLDEYKNVDEHVEETINNMDTNDQNVVKNKEQMKKQLKEEYLKMLMERYNAEKQELIQQLKELTEKISSN